MRTVKTFLAVAFAMALGCRSQAGNPGEEIDSGPVSDTGTAMMDSGGPPLDTGGGRIDTGPCTVMGPENTPGACMDGFDNDCNGFRDCADFSCSRNAAVTFCPDAGPARTDGGGGRVDTTGCVPSGSENTAAACGDGRDNDCDGFVDCIDNNCSCQGSCQSTRAGCTCSGAENTTAACTDGRDNDCNGFIDCVDFSCSRNNPAVTICGDSGAPSVDTGPCTSGPENTNAACSDGCSNDGDRFVDCDDFDCTNAAAVTVCPRDGGVRDAGAPMDTGPRDSGNTRDVTRSDTRGCDSGGARENTAAACTDGVDNDCDGITDCGDRDCSCLASCGPFATGCACTGPENTNATCGDNMDNDCNTFRDCNDFSCSMNNPAVTICVDAGRRD